MMMQMLTEATVLTKGSQRLFADKKVVAAVAARIRQDADLNPRSFPQGASEKFEAATDEQVANWFFRQLDAIEKQGYDGIVYSRDGVNSAWITKVYTSGASSWEDVHGNLNMLLRDWYLLKNKTKGTRDTNGNIRTEDLLEPKHRELYNFKSVNDLSRTIAYFYNDELEDLRTAAARTAQQKSAKSITVVDNDDYRVIVPLNRVASLMAGSGAKWCTCNVEISSYFFTYAGRAMLFIVMPYITDPESGKKQLKDIKVTVSQGRKAGEVISTKEKYQFDAGSGDFMDIANLNVNPPSLIADKFPYLYSDIVSNLEAKKGQIETALKGLADDPAINSKPDTKVIPYDLSDEIKKLSLFLRKGYFTDKVRPQKKEQDVDGNEQGQAEQLPPPQNQQMENFIMKTRYLEEGIFDDLVNGLISTDVTMTPRDSAISNDPLDNRSQRQGVVRQEDEIEADGMFEDDMEADMDDMPPVTGAMSTGSGSSGRAPTMPESASFETLPPESDTPDAVPFVKQEVDKLLNSGMDINSAFDLVSNMKNNSLWHLAVDQVYHNYTKGNMMENVDKDVAEWINRFKAYDDLRASKAPVMEKAMEEDKKSKPDFLDVDKDGDKKEPFKKAVADKEKEEVNEGEFTQHYTPEPAKKPGIASKIAGVAKKAFDKIAPGDEDLLRDLERKSGGKRPANTPVREEADPEVLDWMKRFAKTGR